MRVNEKHLASFACGTAPLDKEGYLSKRGEVNKAFHKRWFVLKGNLLFYYEKKTDKEPIGAIVLEGCTVELSEVNDAFAFELVFEGSGSRTYVLCADTQKDMEDWMKAVACAGYDYMKLMVTELQRQLDDLPNDKSITESSSITAKTVQSRPVQNGDELLVDFNDTSIGAATAAAAPPIPPRNKSTRKNPFNMEEMNLPQPKSFNTSSDGSQHKQNRTFMEMHKEFGGYINKKLAEFSLTDDFLG